MVHLFGRAVGLVVFLLLNLTVVTFLLWLFNRERKVKRPTVLNLKPSQRRLDDTPKDLNVMFMYNGESWDAFEVLGLPAGASPAAAQEAYNLVLKNSDPQTHALFKGALNAIQQYRK